MYSLHVQSEDSLQSSKDNRVGFAENVLLGDITLFCLPQWSETHCFLNKKAYLIGPVQHKQANRHSSGCGLATAPYLSWRSQTKDKQSKVTLF